MNSLLMALDRWRAGRCMTAGLPCFVMNFRSPLDRIVPDNVISEFSHLGPRPQPVHKRHDAIRHQTALSSLLVFAFVRRNPFRTFALDESRIA